jgi:Ca2+-binding RTX toxin-like protein
MTVITFGLSATFPGQTAGAPGNADWVEPVPLMTWDDTLWEEGTNGGTEAGESKGNILSNSLDVAPVALGFFNSDTVDLTYGTSDVANVNVQSFEKNGLSGLGIYLYSPWNSIKDIEISNLSSYLLEVYRFVDTWINAADDNSNHDILLSGTKRGVVALGDGNDTVQVNMIANEYTWPSNFDITTGNGNSTITVQPEQKFDYVSDYFYAPAGWGPWNQTPQLMTANVSVGNGNNTIGLTEVSGTIQVGSGDDTINITDGYHTLWLGAGNDTITIGTLLNQGDAALVARDTHDGTDIVHVASGHAVISIDDTYPIFTQSVTLDFIHGETGGSTLATADVVKFGHVDGGTGDFVGDDLRSLTINLMDYSPGSKATLIAASAGNPMLLQIQDAATGSIDAIALYGSATSVAALNLHFITS